MYIIQRNNNLALVLNRTSNNSSNQFNALKLFNLSMYELEKNLNGNKHFDINTQLYTTHFHYALCNPFGFFKKIWKNN